MKILELVQFEPVVDDDDAWKAYDTINTFIKKSFKQGITPSTREQMGSWDHERLF